MRRSLPNLKRIRKRRPSRPVRSLLSQRLRLRRQMGSKARLSLRRVHRLLRSKLAGLLVQRPKPVRRHKKPRMVTN